MHSVGVNSYLHLYNVHYTGNMHLSVQKELMVNTKVGARGSSAIIAVCADLVLGLATASLER